MNMSKYHAKPFVKIRAKLLFCLIISAALTVTLVLPPQASTVKSKAPSDFNVAGNRKTDSANLTPFTTLPPGSLDPTFGIGGKVTTSISNAASDGANAIAIQSDGKIVLAGYAYNFINLSLDFGLVRYNTNGSLDTSFGTDGKVATDFGGTWERANAVAIQADGKIVAAGYGFLARYNSDGSLDASFDGDGKLTTNFGSASAIAIQADGKIVTAGGVNNAFALARYNPDGSLDPSFGTDGKVITDFSPGADYALGVAIQSNGKIVAAGGSNASCTFVFPQTICRSDRSLARYNIDGSLDNSFGVGGRVTTVYGGDNHADGLAVQSDGRIVTAGGSSLVRYNINGSLDTSFGTNGRATSPSYCWANAVAIQSNGKIVTAGYQDDTYYIELDRYDEYKFALLRYNPNGSPDDAFGTDGKVTTDFGSEYDVINAVAIQPDGKIVAVGATHPSGDDFALARYIGDSVTVSGRVTTPDGRGLRNATVSITDSLGFQQTATTSSFGFYTFDNVTTGEPYRIVVNSRLYRFAPLNLTVTDNLTNVDFVGLD